MADANGQNVFGAPIYQARPSVAAQNSPQAEYEEALAAYNAALKEFNNVRDLGNVQSGLQSLAPDTPAWARVLGDVSKQSLLQDAQRKVEITRQRLERAKARINHSEWPQ
jgi:hypothetical protein